ncbi:hypothetical protein ACFPN2_19305 [Steroidobacter flavus]|uniref:PH domain-containing protein n=1 Tax=Steroidobacter flavus TaxID=1842136 RepID=A0ABV8SVQ7_9GAMM
MRIDLRGLAGMRLPIGLLLLALAGFCIWQGGEPDGLDSLIFGVCVGFFGVLAAGERRFLVVDQSAGVLIKRWGILYAFTVASLPLEQIKRVELTERHIRRRRKDTTRYAVSVAGVKQGALVEYGNEWQARSVGERLSAALRVPFDNRIYGRGSVRDSDELDMHVAERWRVSGKITERPTLPEGSPLVIDDLGTKTRVRFAANQEGFGLGVAMVVIFAVAAALFYPLFGDRFIYYVSFGFAFLVLGSVLLALMGNSRLTFTEDAVSFRQGSAPIERSIELRAIEEMIVAGDALYLVGDSARLTIDWPATSENRAFLKAFVAYEIARRHTARGGPTKSV